MQQACQKNLRNTILPVTAAARTSIVATWTANRSRWCCWIARKRERLFRHALQHRERGVQLLEAPPIHLHAR